jgi:predicted AAA+ superfamily ATPase
MIKRNNYSVIKKLLESFPAVAILGPRQVGKTTIARNEVSSDFSSIYLDLETAEDRAKLSNPAYYFEDHKDKLIILDEVQRIPELFQELRGIIDCNKRAGKPTGQFLLLGSASIDLLKQSGETLAGRIAYHELTPIKLSEYPDDIDVLWVRGGFPDSLLASSEDNSLTWRQNFIRTYLERDIPQLGPRIPAETLRRFWEMLAHLQGTPLNASEIGRSLGIDSKTAMRYLDLMVDLLLVRRLEPIHSNMGKRLIKSPKIYVRDSGLLHALLRIRDKDTLLGHPIVGMSWEGFVIENILNVINSDQIKASFYGKSSENEIDLVLEKPDGEIWAVEVKRSMSPKFSKGYRIASKEIRASRNFIIYPGKDKYRVEKNTEVTNLQKFLKLL